MVQAEPGAAAVSAVPGTHVYGISDPGAETLQFRLSRGSPCLLAERLTKAAEATLRLAVTQRLNLEDKGGMLRVGAVHYNTLDEIGRFGEALKRIAKSA
jgi:selenocysteine lyase/cysteine desulfurase